MGLVKGSILIVETKKPNEEFPKDKGEYKLQLVKVNENERKFEEQVTITVPFAEATLLDVLTQVISPLVDWKV